MDKRSQIKYLDSFINNISNWLKKRSEGNIEEIEEHLGNIQNIWGIIEEIFKQLGISTTGDLSDEFDPKSKLHDGDLFIDGFIGSFQNTIKTKSILKLRGLAMSARTKIKTGIPLVGNTLPSVHQVINILNRLSDVISRLKHRRKGKNSLEVRDEYDIQDILYVMLKGPFPTLQYEDPNKKVGTASSTIDFTIEELGLFIETKYISDKGKEKEIQKQCKEDIISYGNQSSCYRIIFVIFDPSHAIDNEYAFKSGIESKISMGGKELEIIVLITR
ncbi:MAG: hypothetical protein Q8Q95_00175 [bacterium]|nr:hypothetical protein [bacterium]